VISQRNLSRIDGERPVTELNVEAHMVITDTAVAEWLERVRAEYVEVPGMSLTKPQVRRLWGLDPITCDAVIDALLNSGFLKRTRLDKYVRAGEQG
jgi:hypothetical protein